MFLNERGAKLKVAHNTKSHSMLSGNKYENRAREQDTRHTGNPNQTYKCIFTMYCTVKILQSRTSRSDKG